MLIFEYFEMIHPSLLLTFPYDIFISDIYTKVFA